MNLYLRRNRSRICDWLNKRNSGDILNFLISKYTSLCMILILDGNSKLVAHGLKEINLDKIFDALDLIKCLKKIK